MKTRHLVAIVVAVTMAAASVDLRAQRGAAPAGPQTPQSKAAQDMIAKAVALAKDDLKVEATDACLPGGPARDPDPRPMVKVEPLKVFDNLYYVGFEQVVVVVLLFQPARPEDDHPIEAPIPGVADRFGDEGFVRLSLPSEGVLERREDELQVRACRSQTLDRLDGGEWVEPAPHAPCPDREPIAVRHEIGCAQGRSRLAWWVIVDAVRYDGDPVLRG